MERTAPIAAISLKGRSPSHLPICSAEPAIQTANYNTHGSQHFPKRRRRTAISDEQLSKLEALHDREKWPSRAAKEALAKEINTSTQFVNVWFQNKRSRVRKALHEETDLAVNKHRLSTSTKIIGKYRDVPIGPSFSSRSSIIVNGPPLDGGLNTILDSSNQYNKGNLLEVPLAETANKVRYSYSSYPTRMNNQLHLDATKNDQGDWSNFVEEESSSRLHEHRPCVVDGGCTCCTSKGRNNVKTRHYYPLSCSPVNDISSHPSSIFQNKTYQSTSDEGEVHWREDTCLLQTLLNMMIIASGHWNLIKGKPGAQLAIDACLYGLKLKDGKTLIIDRDYGFVLKEDIENDP